jgi:predicted nucleotidyltransferase
VDRYIIEAVNRFENVLTEILGDAIIDIVLYGSTVDGSFIKGKGDIDFLVILNRNVLDEEFEKIKNYHREIRKTDSLEKQIEGCYLTLNKERTIIENGLYIGTGEKGWKRFDGNIYSPMLMAHILEVHYSLKNTGVTESIFEYDWDNVEHELYQQLESNVDMVNKYEDYDFKLHILHTSARCLYTLRHKKFISKIGALEWLESNSGFSKYIKFIRLIKNYKSMLTDKEKNEIREFGFDGLEELIKDIGNNYI